MESSAVVPSRLKGGMCPADETVKLCILAVLFRWISCLPLCLSVTCGEKSGPHEGRGQQKNLRFGKNAFFTCHKQFSPLELMTLTSRKKHTIGFCIGKLVSAQSILIRRKNCAVPVKGMSTTVLVEVALMRTPDSIDIPISLHVFCSPCTYVAQIAPFQHLRAP